MAEREEILRLFPGELRKILGQVPGDFKNIQEIRLRAEQPVLLVIENREYFLTPSGKLEQEPKGAAVISAPQIRETVEYMGNYSLYAFEEEVRRGFLTLQGGHRVGLAGQAVVEGHMESGVRQVKTLKYISFLNVRIAHQRKGCAAGLLPFLCKDGSLLPSLFISPPRCEGADFTGSDPNGIQWDAVISGKDGGSSRRAVRAWSLLPGNPSK